MLLVEQQKGHPECQKPAAAVPRGASLGTQPNWH